MQPVMLNAQGSACVVLSQQTVIPPLFLCIPLVMFSPISCSLLHHSLSLTSVFPLQVQKVEDASLEGVIHSGSRLVLIGGVDVFNFSFSQVTSQMLILNLL